jgi:hypothetical protein
VLVADDVPGGPPGLEVRVLGLGDHDVVEALHALLVVGEIHVELVHAFKVERD